MSEKNVENTIPILGVSNKKDNIRFYMEKLDFILDWNANQVCSVSKDGHAIMLSKVAKGCSPGWVWIGLQDDSLFEIYIKRGVKIVAEPQNFSWAYSMKIEDIDGNILWLATGPKHDQPIVD